MNSTNCNPVYAMMSQGINVVLAKTLLNIECNQKHALAEMNVAWEEKLHRVKLEYDEKIDNQANEIQLLHKELRQLQMFIHGKADCEFAPTVHVNDEFQNVVLEEGPIKDIHEKLRGIEEDSSAVQCFMEDFVKLYECRNGVVDAVITKHENDLKTTRDAICTVSKQMKHYVQDFSAVESKVMRQIDSLPLHFKEHINELKLSNETYVSVDEHNQLRMNLENLIMECDMKCDHVLLTAQHQWDEYKRRCDDADVVKGVLTRAKKRRELALSSIQSKCHVLTELMDNESKTSEIYDDIVHCDSVMKHSHHDDARKVHFHVAATDESSNDGVNENTGYSLQYEMEDNDSEFDISVNLVLLEEHSIH